MNLSQLGLVATELGDAVADKETNTECVFMPAQHRATTSKDAIKRSQTFSPSTEPLPKTDFKCRVGVVLPVPSKIKLKYKLKQNK